MKLEYFDLLSPDAIYIPKVGGIVSPTLREIASVGYHVYQRHLSILLMGTENDRISAFDLLAADRNFVSAFQDALNFFIQETVVYSPENGSFLTRSGDGKTGFITRETYPQICDIICQRNGIRSPQSENKGKAKNAKALQIMKKLDKGRAAKAKQTKSDKALELGNIISSVANKSPSLNILNIWDITVYQLWDCFSRISNNNIYAIQSMSTAVWGNKDHTFDAAAWFRRIDTFN